MNRYPTERLMTIEEAKQLSAVGEEETTRARHQASSIWAWQTVEGAMAQQVSEEQVDQVVARRHD